MSLCVPCSRSCTVLAVAPGVLLSKALDTSMHYKNGQGSQRYDSPCESGDVALRMPLRTDFFIPNQAMLWPLVRRRRDRICQ
jgi:hypothetical protein